MFFFNMTTVMTNGDDNGIRRVWCGDTLSTKTQHGFASYLRKHHSRLLKVRLMKLVFWVHSRTHQLLFLFSYLIWTWYASGWLITKINESKLIFIFDLNSWLWIRMLQNIADSSKIKLLIEINSIKKIVLKGTNAKKHNYSNFFLLR